MTNKEKYKQAFSVLHTSEDFTMEVEKMAKLNNVKRNKMLTAAAAIALCVIVGGSTTAYAANLGNIQRQIQIWFKGDQTDAIMNIKTTGNTAEYEVICEHENGTVHSMHGGGVALDDKSAEARPLTEEEIMEHLNEPNVFYEDDGSAWVYFYDQKMEITDKFNDDGVCRVQVQHGDITYYMTIYYQQGWHMNTDKYVD